MWLQLQTQLVSEALAMSGAALVGERKNKRVRDVGFLCSDFASVVWMNDGTPLG